MTKLLDNIFFENVTQSNKIFTPHFHNTYSIGITHKGLYKSLNQNNTFDFYEYSTRINNPDEIHGGKSINWDNNHIYPSIELMTNLHNQIYNERKIPLFNTHIINDIILYEKLKKVFETLHSKDFMIKETYLIDALTYLIKNYTSKTKDLDNEFNKKLVIKKSIEFINDSLFESISLDKLSSNVNLSKYHFLRVFKNELGLTPHQYILNQKIEKAKSLILQGLPITEAALELGFNDQSHFNRNFKRFYDYSPKQLTKNSNFIL